MARGQKGDEAVPQKSSVNNLALILVGVGALGFAVIGLLVVVAVAVWLLRPVSSPQTVDHVPPASGGTGNSASAIQSPGSASITQVGSESSRAMPPEQVFSRLLLSTTFLVSGSSVGSGFVVDTTRRLVVTNHHVVSGQSDLIAFFPSYSTKGEVITNPNEYVANAKTWGIRARVIASDSGLDLAILQLDRIPYWVKSLPLANAPAATGSSVYSVGCSGLTEDFRGTISGSLWRFSVGTVRGRYADTLRFADGQTVKAMVLETQKPVNRGDSGGATVNDRCEVVSVVFVYDRVNQLVMQDIDVIEVREVFKKNGLPLTPGLPIAPGGNQVAKAPEPIRQTPAVPQPEPRLNPTPGTGTGGAFDRGGSSPDPGPTPKPSEPPKTHPTTPPNNPIDPTPTPPKPELTHYITPPENRKVVMARKPNYLRDYQSAVFRGDKKEAQSFIDAKWVVLLEAKTGAIVETVVGDFSYLRPTEGEYEGEFFIVESVFVKKVEKPKPK